MTSSRCAIADWLEADRRDEPLAKPISRSHRVPVATGTPIFGCIWSGCHETPSGRRDTLSERLSVFVHFVWRRRRQR